MITQADRSEKARTAALRERQRVGGRLAGLPISVPQTLMAACVGARATAVTCAPGRGVKSFKEP